jgi:hypothetical protein
VKCLSLRLWNSQAAAPFPGAAPVGQARGSKGGSRWCRKEIASSWALVRTEFVGGPISEAIWADGYFCAMLINFVTCICPTSSC